MSVNDSLCSSSDKQKKSNFDKFVQLQIKNSVTGTAASISNKNSTNKFVIPKLLNIKNNSSTDCQDERKPFLTSLPCLEEQNLLISSLKYKQNENIEKVYDINTENLKKLHINQPNTTIDLTLAINSNIGSISPHYQQIEINRPSGEFFNIPYVDDEIEIIPKVDRNKTLSNQMNMLQFKKLSKKSRIGKLFKLKHITKADNVRHINKVKHLLNRFSFTEKSPDDKILQNLGKKIVWN